jgi:hypothetical protein
MTGLSPAALAALWAARKIMRSFYDFGRHDFAAVSIRIGNARLKRLSESR